MERRPMKVDAYIKNEMELILEEKDKKLKEVEKQLRLAKDEIVRLNVRMKVMVVDEEYKQRSSVTTRSVYSNANDIDTK